jgi:YaiO family outer membrane protein
MRALLIAAVTSLPAALQGQAAPPPLRPPASSVEVGGFYQHVSHDFGSWTGGYGRLVLAGSRDVWYADAKVQEAFRDRGVYGGFANVHHFGDRVFTQIGIGAGSGKYVLPKFRGDAAVTLKLFNRHALLLTAGGTWVKSKSVYTDKALVGSLAWYAGPYALLELGGRLNWSNPGSVRSERVSGALTLGRPGGLVLTLRGGAGTEGYQLTGATVTLQRFRSQEAGATLHTWLSRSFGVVEGAEWYHNPFYTRAGGSLGLFYAW